MSNKWQDKRKLPQVAPGEFLDKIQGKIFSLGGLSSISTVCWGRCLRHYPWSYLKGVQMWCLGTWSSGGLGTVRLMIGLRGHRCLLPVKQFHDFVLLLTAYHGQKGAGIKWSAIQSPSLLITPRKLWSSARHGSYMQGGLPCNAQPHRETPATH